MLKLVLLLPAAIPSAPRAAGGEDRHVQKTLVVYLHYCHRWKVLRLGAAAESAGKHAREQEGQTNYAGFHAKPAALAAV
jgi:hypothetical protein